MNLIQFELPKKGRRVGLINGNEVVDLTNINTAWTHTYYLFLEANKNGTPFKFLNPSTISFLLVVNSFIILLR